MLHYLERSRVLDARSYASTPFPLVPSSPHPLLHYLERSRVLDARSYAPTPFPLVPPSPHPLLHYLERSRVLVARSYAYTPVSLGRYTVVKSSGECTGDFPRKVLSSRYWSLRTFLMNGFKVRLLAGRDSKKEAAQKRVDLQTET